MLLQQSLRSPEAQEEPRPGRHSHNRVALADRPPYPLHEGNAVRLASVELLLFYAVQAEPDRLLPGLIRLRLGDEGRYAVNVAGVVIALLSDPARGQTEAAPEGVAQEADQGGLPGRPLLLRGAQESPL